MARTVFIVSQHGYGIGHLMRSCALADELAGLADMTVYLFSGGRPSGGIGVPRRAFFVQLPPTEFARLTDTGTIVTRPVNGGSDAATVEAQRSSILLHYFRLLQPEAVVVEYFPFAPERFGTTLDALLNEARAARPRPRLICSVRTFPTDPTNARASDVRHLMETYFDLVLHHTDPHVYPPDVIGDYFHEAVGDVLVEPTGFVSRNTRPPPSPATGRNGLLFTVGGGRDGADLLERWLQAAVTAGVHGTEGITAVCGPFMPASDVDRIMRWARHSGITILRSLTDDAMMQLLVTSRGLVCMGGYNTLNEALESRTPTLAFPRPDYREQLKHVDILSSRGLVLSGADASNINGIVAGIEELLRFECRHSIDFSGSATSARLIAGKNQDRDGHSGSTSTSHR